MKKLKKLSKDTHQSLKINPQKALVTAAKNQILNLKVSEVSLAATNFPVFLMPNVATGGWSISALTSFVAGTNLYLNQEQWEATYLPKDVQTYPFYLINSEGDDKGYTVGIDEESDALSETDGDPLFLENGVASMHLSQVTKLLETELQNAMHTARFIEQLEELKLIKAITLVLHYEDGTAQNLAGLHTIDEEKLSLLPGSTLEALNKQGYLAQLYALLMSLYQVNLLILKNNAVKGFEKIKQVKMELTRDKNATRG